MRCYKRKSRVDVRLLCFGITLHTCHTDMTAVAGGPLLQKERVMIRRMAGIVLQVQLCQYWPGVSLEVLSKEGVSLQCHCQQSSHSCQRLYFYSIVVICNEGRGSRKMKPGTLQSLGCCDCIEAPPSSPVQPFKCPSSHAHPLRQSTNHNVFQQSEASFTVSLIVQVQKEPGVTSSV